MTNTSLGTPPFVAQWQRHREQWAEELGRSLLFWYRQEYKIPRHDPRLDDLTPEVLWIEYRAWEIFHTPPKSAGEQLTDAWMDAVEAGTVDPTDPQAKAAFAAQWHALHPTEEMQQVDDWEHVPGEEGGVFRG